jgi:WD40 repeat protein
VIDWKSRFRTKTNWINGKARLHEVEVSNPHKRPLIARVTGGLIFTAGPLGLRAWSTTDGYGAPLAQFHVETTSEATCIAAETQGNETTVLLGFADGSCSLYAYTRFGLWKQLSKHPSADGPLQVVALAHPYMMTISKTKFLTIYDLTSKRERNATSAGISLIARLQSDASFSPISISLRHTPVGFIATVAYAFSRLHSGWAIGLQELRFNSAARSSARNVSDEVLSPSEDDSLPTVEWEMITRFTSSTPLPLHPQIMSPPTSLSYEHPYLISTLADNTLMSYLVTSNDQKLEITSGRRLWGHTSAVSGAEVDKRGKAVSVSSRGGEMRVWELEAVMTGVQDRTSTQVKTTATPSGLASALSCRLAGSQSCVQEVKQELELSRRWVGFDERQVAVLGETADHKQIMSLYDFT